MSRWQPNARGRLVEAAMELYAERGYEQTTVAEIAARAGLTERTFFRYFTDKREVLFAGSDELRTTLVETLGAAPVAATPLEAVATALEAAGAVLQERTGHARAAQRKAVIATHAELHERELIKLASLATALATALRQRGIKEPAASLAAEAGIAAFKVAFQAWIDDPKPRDLTHHIRTTLGALQALVPPPPRRSKAAARSRAKR